MFKNEVLNEIVNKYRENRLAHAYLIETNNIAEAKEDIKALIKVINCPETYKESCENCTLCNLINKNNLPSIKIVEPDGTSIKKSQIEELKQSFECIPVYSKFNVYIIVNAEKLNASSANSMLKFVEEPTSGILGFFITSNKDIMIDTIKSRCQSLVVNYEPKNILERLNIDEEIYENYLKIIKEYLEKLENNFQMNHKKLILNTFSERKDIEKIIKIIFEIYYNHFLKINGKEYTQELTEIYELKDNNTKTCQKLQIITKVLNDLSYNVSIELILDKFAIEMRGTNG